VTIGLIHPGEMGAAFGAALTAAGETVLWASAGRSAETAERAAQGGLEDVGTVDELARQSDIILSICPPGSATEVARSVGAFEELYIDANAIAPATARAISTLVPRYVDGGIIGPAPVRSGQTRLYLSGAGAPAIADLFSKTIVEPVVVSAEPGTASAVKLAYAAWTKGIAALLLATRAYARNEGVDEVLLEQWRTLQPHLAEQSNTAARTALHKGWRFVGEMEEIADAFASTGLPTGFHLAAAEIYGRAPHERSGDDALDRALSGLTSPELTLG
jgi:3-hydroxyisobutyrate dehydrogenase-like beta-hydroxyacid dehydrogenase